MKAKITEKTDGDLLALVGLSEAKGYSSLGYNYHGSGKPGDKKDVRFEIIDNQIYAVDIP